MVKTLHIHTSLDGGLRSYMQCSTAKNKSKQKAARRKRDGKKDMEKNDAWLPWCEHGSVL